MDVMGERYATNHQFNMREGCSDLQQSLLRQVLQIDAPWGIFFTKCLERFALVNLAMYIIGSTCAQIATLEDALLYTFS